MTSKYIKFIDGGRTQVAHLADSVTPIQAATEMGLTPGTWQEITAAEATELQAPTPLELAATRLTTINTRLSEIDAARSWPLADLALGINVEFAREKLEGFEAERAGLGSEKLAILAEWPEL